MHRWFRLGLPGLHYSGSLLLQIGIKCNLELFKSFGTQKRPITWHLHDQIYEDTTLLDCVTLSLIKIDHFADFPVKILNSFMNDPIIAKFHDIDAEISLACHWMAVASQSGRLLNSMLQFVAHLTDHYFRELFKQ